MITSEQVVSGCIRCGFRIKDHLAASLAYHMSGAFTAGADVTEQHVDRWLKDNRTRFDGYFRSDAPQAPAMERLEKSNAAIAAQRETAKRAADAAKQPLTLTDREMRLPPSVRMALLDEKRAALNAQKDAA